ncbi:MAG TPA: NAD(P)/FAD-dependent oxidoreductase [Candidatus Acidoferrum sp.]|nr:NAD(P)/FAD-dependent oxidoreductase [Candidatus Acidoferrum sp.]
MYDCIIIGAGPAGLSAALYTKRAGRSTLMLTNNVSSLNKAEHIDNYFGFSEGVSGKELLESGLEQVKRLGAEVVECQATRLEPGSPFIVHTNKGKFEGKTVLIATGATRAKRAGLNLDEFEGRGVSYCATCDGFFFRDKDVAVLGGGEYAAAEAEELTHFAASVTALTDGAPQADFGAVKVIEKKPRRLVGGDALEAVEFEDDSSIRVAGLFVAIGVASALDFARSAGIITGPSAIEVDEKMQTSIPGVFAAGDCVGGLLQVSKAVGEGALAGTGMIAALREK